MKKAGLRATSTRAHKKIRPDPVFIWAFPLDREMKPMGHTARKLTATEEYRVLTAFIV